MLALIEMDSAAAASASGDSVRRVAEVARLAGSRVYRVPVDFDAVGGAEAALWHIPRFEVEEPAVWVGFILPPERYALVYAELLRLRNIRLLNSPAEHDLAEEFDRFYPRISELTARSVVLDSAGECAELPEGFTFPVFVKGTVQSLKLEGPRSCIAYDADDLRRISARLLRHESRTRGRVIVRELLQLRSERLSGIGMPAGREFRVFFYRGEVLALGYYWPEPDRLAQLDAGERAAVVEVAVAVARRLAVPYLAVDVGQLMSGAWIAIEVCDAQFGGLCQAPPFQLWNRLEAAVSAT